MKRTTVFFSLVLSYACIAAAQTAPVNAFIMAALKDRDLREQKNIIEYLEKSSANTPLIDDAEVRVRNRGFEFDKQRYALRIEPRGLGETRAGRELYASTLKYHTQKKNVLEHDLITDQYLFVIELLNRQALHQLHNEMITLYEDKLNVLKKQADDARGDLSDIISAEDKLTRFRFANIERERRIAAMQNKIARELKDESLTTFDTTGLIGVESICKEVDSTIYTVDKSNLHLKLDRLNFQQARNRYNLENAEGRQWISFLEFSFDQGEYLDQRERKYDGKLYDLNQAYGLQLAVRIPYINVDRHDLHRRKLSYLNAKEDARDLERRLKRRLEKDAEDIRVLVSQYNFLMARKEDINAESSLKKYLAMDGVDPLILISVRESIIENDIELEKITFDIYRNYIRLLDASGAISEKPFRNYLSATRDVMVK